MDCQEDCQENCPYVMPCGNCNVCSAYHTCTDKPNNAVCDKCKECFECNEEE